MRDQSAAGMEVSPSIRPPLAPATRARSPPSSSTMTRAFACSPSTCSAIQYQTDDVLQDAYVKAFRALSAFRRQVGPLSTWLTRITYTTCIDHLRRRARLVLVPDLEPERAAAATAPTRPTTSPIAAASVGRSGGSRPNSARSWCWSACRDSTTSTPRRSWASRAGTVASRLSTARTHPEKRTSRRRRSVGRRRQHRGGPSHDRRASDSRRPTSRPRALGPRRRHPPGAAARTGLPAATPDAARGRGPGRPHPDWRRAVARPAGRRAAAAAA